MDKAELKQEMYLAMKEVLGDGYIKAYYTQNMQDFYDIAIHYAECAKEAHDNAIRTEVAEECANIDVANYMGLTYRLIDRKDAYEAGVNETKKAIRNMARKYKEE